MFKDNVPSCLTLTFPNGKTSQIESIRSTQYTSLYGKGIKEKQIKSMETTEGVVKKVQISMASFINYTLSIPESIKLDNFQ